MFENLKENAKNLVYNKKFIIIVCLAALFTGVAFYFYSSYVAPRLDPSFATNKEFIPKGDDVHEVEVLFFYTTWCPYCKKARPAWDGMKKMYDNKVFNGKTIYFKEIDCEKNEKLADQYSVEGYPTIKLVKGDQVVDFDAKPTQESLTEFFKTSI